MNKEMIGTMNGRTVEITVSVSPAGAWRVEQISFAGSRNAYDSNRRQKTAYYGTEQMATEKAMEMRARYEKRGAQFRKDNA